MANGVKLTDKITIDCNQFPELINVLLRDDRQRDIRRIGARVNF